MHFGEAFGGGLRTVVVIDLYNTGVLAAVAFLDVVDVQRVAFLTSALTQRFAELRTTSVVLHNHFMDFYLLPRGRVTTRSIESALNRRSVARVHGLVHGHDVEL